MPATESQLVRRKRQETGKWSHVHGQRWLRTWRWIGRKLKRILVMAIVRWYLAVEWTTCHGAKKDDLDWCENVFTVYNEYIAGIRWLKWDTNRKTTGRRPTAATGHMDQVGAWASARFEHLVLYLPLSYVDMLKRLGVRHTGLPSWIPVKVDRKNCKLQYSASVR